MWIFSSLRRLKCFLTIFQSEIETQFFITFMFLKIFHRCVNDYRYKFVTKMHELASKAHSKGTSGHPVPFGPHEQILTKNSENRQKSDFLKVTQEQPKLLIKLKFVGNVLWPKATPKTIFVTPGHMHSSGMSLENVFPKFSKKKNKNESFSKLCLVGVSSRSTPKKCLFTLRSL